MEITWSIVMLPRCINQPHLREVAQGKIQSLQTANNLTDKPNSRIIWKDRPFTTIKWARDHLLKDSKNQ